MYCFPIRVVRVEAEDRHARLQMELGLGSKCVERQRVGSLGRRAVLGL